MYRFVSLAGFIVLLGFAWLISENRGKRQWRILIWACALQWGLALLVLRVPFGAWVFQRLETAVGAVLAASDAGAAFLFGNLVGDFSTGAIVAFRVLPIVIFVSALASLFCHWGLVQKIIHGMAWVMRRTMRISGLEALGSALFVFFGIETITGIRDYLKESTRSEMFTLMTAFMATIAGSVMGAYVSFGVSAAHLLAASLMSAPAAIAVAKLMIPETGEPSTAGDIRYDPEVETAGSVDALSRGALSGLTLALNIGACLIAFVGVIHLINIMLSAPTEYLFGSEVTLEMLFGYLMSPFAVLMGVPLEEATDVGRLLGMKTAVNEFVAYQRLQGMMTGEGALSERAQLISTYALCGFANFGSVAILVGGISTLVPERRAEIAKLGLKALVSGTLAAFLTACVAGVIG